MQEVKYKVCIWRRLVGGLVALIPIFLAGYSFVNSYESSFSWLAFGLVCFALIITVGNFNCTVVQPSRWRRKNGSMDGYKNTSVVPLLGTIFGVAGCFLGYGNELISIMAVFVFIFDFGGITWFVYATWSDSSFWDTEIL